ncbi:MAG: hypothetical protein N2109_07195 [Fimbriimonadales bacterium]|nr:hypothetical protein [Fimbriimonadales bacterium]
MRTIWFAALMAALAWSAVGCGSQSEPLTKDEMQRLQNPSKEPPPEASAGPPPGGKARPASSLDPGYESPAPAQGR